MTTTQRFVSVWTPTGKARHGYDELDPEADDGKGNVTTLCGLKVHANGGNTGGEFPFNDNGGWAFDPHCVRCLKKARLLKEEA